jgi:hypothetical protein
MSIFFNLINKKNLFYNFLIKSKKIIREKKVLKKLNSGKKGFSLIELSFVFIIGGMVFVGSTKIFNALKKKISLPNFDLIFINAHDHQDPKMFLQKLENDFKEIAIDVKLDNNKLTFSNLTQEQKDLLYKQMNNIKDTYKIKIHTDVEKQIIFEIEN